MLLYIQTQPKQQGPWPFVAALSFLVILSLSAYCWDPSRDYDTVPSRSFFAKKPELPKHGPQPPNFVMQNKQLPTDRITNQAVADLKKMTGLPDSAAAPTNDKPTALTVLRNYRTGRRYHKDDLNKLRDSMTFAEVDKCLDGYGIITSNRWQAAPDCTRVQRIYFVPHARLWITFENDLLVFWMKMDPDDKPKAKP